MGSGHPTELACWMFIATSGEWSGDGHPTYWKGLLLVNGDGHPTYWRFPSCWKKGIGLPSSFGALLVGMGFPHISWVATTLETKLFG